MSDGAAFFNANKAGRNAPFAVVATDGKITAGIYDSSPFGDDKNGASHVQPADISEASGVMPGEQPDPRFC